MKRRVVIGMSGGVTVRGGLFAEAAGYDVVGLFMKNWKMILMSMFFPTGFSVASVADVIDIYIKWWFLDRVQGWVSHFLAEYQAGNPES